MLLLCVAGDGHERVSDTEELIENKEFVDRLRNSCTTPPINLQSAKQFEPPLPEEAGHHPLNLEVSLLLLSSRAFFHKLSCFSNFHAMSQLKKG